MESSNTSLYHIFSCNHWICLKCATRIIEFYHMKSIIKQDQIQISCPCTFGTKFFAVTDILQMLTNSNATATSSKMFDINPKLNCVKCQLLLCEDCSKSDRVVTSHHQPTQGQISFGKGDLKGQIKDHYCLDCQECFCLVCSLYKHPTHNYQLIKEYGKELMTQIRVSDSSMQVSQIEENIEDFKTQVSYALKKTMKNLEEQTKLMETLKLISKEKSHYSFQRVDLVFNLLKFCYLEFNKNQATQDIHQLFSAWDIEFHHLTKQDEHAKKLIAIDEAFRESVKMQPIGVIHADWSLRDWRKKTLTLRHNSAVYSLFQMKDGRIISGSWDNTIKVWEVKDKEFRSILAFIGHDSPVSSLIQLQDGRIASASEDKKITIWKEEEYSFIKTITVTGHEKWINSVIQLKDGRLASAAGDPTIKIWKVKEKELKNTLTLTGHSRSVNALIQMKDGRIASGSSDKTIKIWVERENVIRNTLTLIGDDGSVQSLVQLKDGRIVSGLNNSNIKIWEVTQKEFKNTQTLTGHKHYVSSLIQLKDGRIASGSYDMTIKVWEVKGKEFTNTLTLTGHDRWITSLIQLKDERIAAGSVDKTIKIWE